MGGRGGGLIGVLLESSFEIVHLFACLFVCLIKVKCAAITHYIFYSRSTREIFRWPSKQSKE